MFLAAHGGFDAADGVPTFLRGPRTRDDRYPALLLSTEKVYDMEKLYDLTSINGHCCQMTSADYNMSGTNDSSVTENEANLGKIAAVNASAVTLVTTNSQSVDKLDETSSRFQDQLYTSGFQSACPHCIKRNCRCPQQQQQQQQQPHQHHMMHMSPESSRNADSIPPSDGMRLGNPARQTPQPPKRQHEMLRTTLSTDNSSSAVSGHTSDGATSTNPMNTPPTNRGHGPQQLFDLTSILGENVDDGNYYSKYFQSQRLDENSAEVNQSEVDYS